jgi:hypothetical protein
MDPAHDPRNIEMGRLAMSWGWLSKDHALHCLNEATRHRCSLAEIGQYAALLTHAQSIKLLQSVPGFKPGEIQDVIPTALGINPMKSPAPSPPHPVNPDQDKASLESKKPAPSESKPGSKDDRQPSSHSKIGSTPKAGDVIDGYKILRLLGQGGMGAVFVARREGVDYALKVITSLETQALTRFKREAQAVAAVDGHPNIVKIHSYSNTSEMPYIVLDLIEGRALDSDLHEAQPYDIEESLKIVIKLASALQHSHDQGVLHRDLKPANILIRRADKEVLLTDFGLAKASDAGSLTKSSDLLGTPHYMSPEQAGSEHDKMGPGTDIWALGAILYQLTTGYLPFPGSTVLSIVKNILFKDPIAPSIHNPKLGQDLETIILKALQKHIPERYQSARELAADCQLYLAGEPIKGKRITTYRHLTLTVKRRYGERFTEVALVLIIALSLTLIAAANYFFISKPKNMSIKALETQLEVFKGSFPRKREADCFYAASEALQQLKLGHLIGPRSPKTLIDDNLFQQRDLFREKLRQFPYSAKDYPKSFANGRHIWHLQHAEFLEQLVRLRTYKSENKKQGLIRDSKTNTLKWPAQQAERQFLRALQAIHNGEIKRAIKQLRKLQELSRRLGQSSRLLASDKLVVRRFEELGMLLRALLIANKSDWLWDPGAALSRLLKTIDDRGGKSTQLAGLYSYLKLKSLELRTLQQLFNRRLSEESYNSQGQRICKQLEAAYRGFARRSSKLYPELNQQRQIEQLSDKLGDTIQNQSKQFCARIVREAKKLEASRERQSERLYFQLLYLLFTENHQYFSVRDLSLFRTGYLRELKRYKERDQDPLYFARSLEYVSLCIKIEPRFFVPSEFSRDNILIVIQSGYQKARAKAQMRQLKRQENNVAEMETSVWRSFYQMIVSSSRSGVFSAVMGREILEPLWRQGILQDEIRRYPDDPIRRFWRGMLNPVQSHLIYKLASKKKAEDEYRKVITTCINDLTFAMSYQQLPQAFRAVALTRRIELISKLNSRKKTLEKLNGLKAVERDLDWATRHHPCPEAPLLQKLLTRLPITTRDHQFIFEGLEEVIAIIKDRWLRSCGPDSKAVNAALSRGRAPGNPMNFMTRKELEDKTHKVQRFLVNRLNVLGRHQEALQLADRALKFKVRSVILCERILALIGLGREEDAAAAYSKLQKTEHASAVVEFWGQNRSALLRQEIQRIEKRSKKN